MAGGKGEGGRVAARQLQRRLLLEGMRIQGKDGARGRDGAFYLQQIIGPVGQQRRRVLVQLWRLVARGGVARRDGRGEDEPHNTVAARLLRRLLVDLRHVRQAHGRRPARRQVAHAQ